MLTIKKCKQYRGVRKKAHSASPPPDSSLYLCLGRLVAKLYTQRKKEFLRGWGHPIYGLNMIAFNVIQMYQEEAAEVKKLNYHKRH